MEAVLQSNYGSIATLPQSHRADFLTHVPSAKFSPVGSAAKDPAIEAIDPVQALLFDVPDWALAKGRFNVSNDFDPHVFTILLFLLKG
ncbi:hypothetical protein ABH907_003703 [Pseudomonas frederiksbergensis]|jgi:hypothetical protein